MPESRSSPRKAKLYLRRLMIVINILLALHFTSQVTAMISENKRFKFYHIKADHLKFLGFLLLDHYRNCGEMPENIMNAADLQECISYEIGNNNVTDYYNKPLFYLKVPGGAIITHYNNTAFFKTEVSLDTTAVLVDTEFMMIRSIHLYNHSIENCCHWMSDKLNHEPPSGYNPRKWKQDRKKKLHQ